MTERYIKSIRKETNYPAFRSIINFYAAIGYIISILALIAGLIINKDYSALVGLAIALAIAMLTKVAHETASIMVDIADSSVSAAEKQSQILSIISSSHHQPTQALSTTKNPQFTPTTTPDSPELITALHKVAQFGPDAAAELRNLYAKTGDVMSISRITEIIIEKYSSPR